MNTELSYPKRQPTLQFSTDEVLPRDRLAVWREVLGRVHLHLDVEQVGEGPLHATVESHRWSHTSLYFSNTTPVRASRTREFLQDGDGDFRILISRGAGYYFSSGSREEFIADGAAALLFNGAASSVQYAGPCRVTAVRVRRAELAQAVANLEDAPIRPVLPDSRALRLLCEYVEFLRKEGPATDAALAQSVADHITDLVALSLGATKDAIHLARGRGIRAARLVAIKSDIAASIGDSSLSADTIAARQQISPRYVRQLFESEGLSFSDFLVQARLTRAYELLSNPANALTTISGVAFECGFGDLSYFNRTFKKRYGATPSDIRQRALEKAGFR
jgi:AraC-like DNA-binding protein